jgi:hypothetical protein
VAIVEITSVSGVSFYLKRGKGTKDMFSFFFSCPISHHLFFILLLLLFFTLQYCIGFTTHQHTSTMGVVAAYGICVVSCGVFCCGAWIL